MATKTPQCCVADMSDPNKPSGLNQADASSAKQCRSSQHNGGTSSSSPESGSSNGETKRSGKRRRSKKCSSRPDDHAEVNASKTRDKPDDDDDSGDDAERQAGLMAECANVWFQRSVYERAESLYQRWLANSTKVELNGSTSRDDPSSTTTTTKPPEKKSLKRAQVKESSQLSIIDEAPTPVVVAAARPPLNGLSPVLAQMFRDVWLEKPRYDRAEAAFYQNMHGNNSSKKQTPPPRFLQEEVEGKRAAPQGKAEVFHALHPIQEEEEPSETLAKRHLAVCCYFLHPDSERAWLDKWRYDAAEVRFHAAEAAVPKEGGAKTDASAIGFTGPLRENNMSAVNFLRQEKIWFDKSRYDEAERRFFERVHCASRATPTVCSTCSSSSAADQELISRIKSLEQENKTLHRVVEDLRASLSKLESRVSVLEKSPAAGTAAASPSVPYTNGTCIQQTGVLAKQDDDDDDDIDLFGSDDDEEAEKLKEQRLKEYAERKAKKPSIVAKSSILLDVKPWDDETDMSKLEECVRSVRADGLLWGVSKLVPVGYGIKKLQIACVVEDDKVGTDMLEEEITKFEDYVQSVDVAAFNKI
ncbi:eukaryotic translation elongation factor 1 delta b (guanine nucleotide exchange protein) isoform X2 [Festucalex cinctus]